MSLLRILFFFRGDDVVVELDEIGEVVDDDFSVIVDCGTWIIVKPKHFEGGKFDKVSDLPEVGDAVLA